MQYSWSAADASSLTLCMARTGLPISTPLIAMLYVSMLPSVLPPATSLRLTNR